MIVAIGRDENDRSLDGVIARFLRNSSPDGKKGKKQSAKEYLKDSAA
jgi:hypothetical protein